MDFFDNFMTVIKDVRLHPLAVPVLIGLATVLATVVLFYVISSAKRTNGRKTSQAASDRTKKRTSEQGLRRSSRYVWREDRDYLDCHS